MNRHITRLVLAFVAGSLGATLLPLLDGGGGVPLIGVADRSTSLIVHAGFLLIFSQFLFPCFAARDESGRIGPWAAMASFILVFATIPLLFSAYISGVSLAGLTVVLALVAMGFGLALWMRRLWGPRGGARATAVCGALLLFVLPLVLVYLASVGRSPGPEWARASVFHWLQELAQERRVPDAWPFLVGAALLWILALAPLRLRRRSVAAAGGLACLVIAGAASPVSPVESRISAAVVQSPPLIRSLAGGAARPGLRTPLRIEVRARAGQTSAEVVLELDGDRQRGWADGQERDYSFVVAKASQHLTVRWPDGVEVQARLPLELVGGDQHLVAHIDGLGSADASEVRRTVAGTESSVRLITLDAAALPLDPGAMEAFDALIMGGDWRARATPEIESVCDRFVALGGRRIELAATGDRAQRQGAGLVQEVALAGLPAALSALPPPTRGVFDRGLLDVFTPRGWQELDLSRLILFAICYHLAFLCVFLIPLRLDAGKALGVYIASVGFVVVLVAGVAWQVLDRIFLADTQVYSHAVAIGFAGEGEPTQVGVHQFLCFASMSGEQRDLNLAGARDVVIYRAGPRAQTPLLATDRRGTMLENVALDRFRSRLMVRHSEPAWLPFRLEPLPGDGGYEVRSEPLGEGGALGGSRLVALYRVEDGAWSAAYRREGERMIPDPRGTGRTVPREAELYFRRLAGRFARAPRSSYLLARLEGMGRPDATESYFWVRDLGAWIILPLPQ